MRIYYSSTVAVLPGCQSRLELGGELCHLRVLPVVQQGPDAAQVPPQGVRHAGHRQGRQRALVAVEHRPAGAGLVPDDPQRRQRLHHQHPSLHVHRRVADLLPVQVHPPCKTELRGVGRKAKDIS